jgi:gamma-glutamylcyclotransferase (GGCT)/AIG2-like uncharacterized protein YtfP
VTETLFSFGTLQQENVQRELFGRSVPTTPDVLTGHRVGRLTILDPEVIVTSGSDVHPALVATGSAEDVVPGSVLEVTAEELAAADHYERVSYVRAEVTLASGRTAWVYLPRNTSDVRISTEDGSTAPLGAWNSTGGR